MEESIPEEDTELIQHSEEDFLKKKKKDNYYPRKETLKQNILLIDFFK